MKHPTRGATRQPRGSRKIRESINRSCRELIGAAMKKVKATSPVGGSSTNTLNGSRSGNGAIVDPPKPVFRYPKTELEAAIQRYVDLFDFAPIGYVTFDRVRRIEEINVTATRLVGRPRKHLIGAPFVVCVAKTDAQLFLRHLLECRFSKGPVETEVHLKTRDGVEFPVLLSSTPASSSMKNGVLLFQTALVDLSARQRAEESLRQSEKRYRTLFDVVPVAVYACDAEGLIQEFNQRAVELWGRESKKDDLNARFCGSFKMFYPDGRPMPHEKCPMARVLRGEKLQASDLEVVVEQANGARRSVLVSPSALKNERGKIIGAINCVHDITERNRTENALRESEERYRAIVSQSTVGMARSD